MLAIIKGYPNGNAVIRLSMSLLANGLFDLYCIWGCTLQENS